MGDPTEPEIECEEQLESDGEENLTTECKEQLESENGEDPITEGKEQPETENGEAPTTEDNEKPGSENGEGPTTEGEQKPETENGEDPTTEGEEQSESGGGEDLANACESQSESESEENLAAEGEEKLESDGEEDLAMDCEEEEEPETDEKLEVDCEEEFYIEEELVIEEEEQLGSNNEEEPIIEGEEPRDLDSEENSALKCKKFSPKSYPLGPPVSSVGPIGEIDFSKLDEDDPNELERFTQMETNKGVEFPVRDKSGRSEYLYFGDLNNTRSVNSLEDEESYIAYGDDWSRPLPTMDTTLASVVDRHKDGIKYIQAENFVIATALDQNPDLPDGIVTYYYNKGIASDPSWEGNGLVIAHGNSEDDNARFQSGHMPILKLFKNEETHELIAYAAVIVYYPLSGYKVDGYVKIKMKPVGDIKGRINVSMKYWKLNSTWPVTNFAYSVHMDIGGRHEKSRLFSLGNNEGFYFYEKGMGDGTSYALTFFRDGFANPPAKFKGVSDNPNYKPFTQAGKDGIYYNSPYYNRLNSPGYPENDIDANTMYKFEPHPGWSLRWEPKAQGYGEVIEANLEVAVTDRPDAAPVLQLDNDGEYTDNGYRITGTWKDKDSDTVGLYYMIDSSEPKKVGDYKNENLNTDAPWELIIQNNEWEEGLDHEISVYVVDEVDLESNIETIKLRPKLEITEQVFDESDKKDPTEVAPGETLKYEISVDTGYIADDEGTYGQFTISQKYDPHLEPPTDLKIIDGSGYEMGTVEYDEGTNTIEAKPYPNLPRSTKVKVTFNAKVAEDATEGEFVIGQAIAKGTYSTGDEFNQTSNELKTLISGVLKFVSAPEVIGFGEKLTISPRTKTYHLSQFDERLAVKDSRALLRNPSWKMTAKLVKPLTGGENKDSILDGLYYHYGGTVSTLTEDASALVYEKETTTREEINISNTWTPKGDGLYLEVPAGTAKVGGYEGTIQWTLQNVPLNEE
ncbi:hypothetical protein [Lysinibacillus sphaericus]|uniref:hypothetical protein n=1 Tax=Lysinibacillus sphaericus TaxID=1421 RepID=UPI0018CD0A2F|nr:hypothetical protein [Lysinibacillus sphaericus]